jgi:hypothetical protein
VVERLVELDAELDRLLHLVDLLSDVPENGLKRF